MKISSMMLLVSGCICMLVGQITKDTPLSIMGLGCWILAAHAW